MWCTMLGTNKHQGNIQRILTKADLDKLKTAKPSGSQLVQDAQARKTMKAEKPKLAMKGTKPMKPTKAMKAK